MTQTAKKLIEKIASDKIYRIAFYGDSITSAEWVHPNWREIIEYVLKDFLVTKTKEWWIPSWRIRADNCALDGATTIDLNEEIDRYVLKLNPNLIILMAGKNDIYKGVGIREHEQELEKLLTGFKESKIKTIFCSSTPSLEDKINKKFKPYTENYSKITDKCDTQYVNIFEKLQKFPLKSFFTFKLPFPNEAVGLKKGDLDPLHPNQLGNAYIAKILLKDIFGIEFDAEKYKKGVDNGDMYPKYY